MPAMPIFRRVMSAYPSWLNDLTLGQNNNLLFAADFVHDRTRLFLNKRQVGEESLAIDTDAKWLQRGGLWVQSLANSLPNSDDGLIIEESRTTLAQKSRRLDDASYWTATNINTSAVAGIDGITGSATRLSSTGGTPRTIFGSVNTAAAANCTLAPFVRYVSGAGDLEWTLDGGSTWTAYTGLTSAYQRKEATVNVANPQVGFRITSGNSDFDIDFANGETGAFATSPIESSTSQVTRAADIVYLDFSGGVLNDALTLAGQIEPFGGLNNQPGISLSKDGDAQNRIHVVGISTTTVQQRTFVSNATQGDLSTAIGAVSEYRFATRSKANDRAFYAAEIGSSALSSTSSSGDHSDGLNRLRMSYPTGVGGAQVISRLVLWTKAYGDDFLERWCEAT